MTEHMRALLGRAAQGERAAEETLLRENSGLIYGLAARFYGRGVEREDIQQLAAVGFLKAVRGFDLSLGTEFSTYAVPKIMGEIRRFLRDDGTIKVSRVLREQSARLRRAQSDFEAETGRAPTVSELAVRTGLCPEEVAACEASAAPVDSLEREMAGGGCLGDRIGGESMEEKTVWRLSLAHAVEGLAPREKTILFLRYQRGLTQQQTARLVGVSQVQVSRLEKKAIQTLRALLE